ncbi:hypothetical protein K0M31_008971 [Melipona bicolor]|uniref:Uncharacterized protein n=1 Tax=Melipona bicolor TaxID=60889 RepID=A0AA40FPG8_9HYME|nr:hypothetical protein K0M31_008971 [Melipona bicolor]
MSVRSGFAIRTAVIEVRLSSKCSGGTRGLEALTRSNLLNVPLLCYPENRSTASLCAESNSTRKRDTLMPVNLKGKTVVERVICREYL